MIEFVRRMGYWLTQLIDPFRAADGPPPQSFVPFARWALKGSEKGIAVTIIVVVLAGLAELVVAWFTGWVIDATEVTGRGEFWSSYWPIIFAGAAFFLIVRPIIFTADAMTTGVILGPHLFPLILSRINRHTLGHSMQYFENDFAGRIAQKSMQTARALTDIVVEICDVVIFGLAMFIGALVLVGGIDIRLLGIFVIWGVLYGITLRYFIPRVRVRSAARAGARTAVTGQIVDTMSNIATVKLFAHDRHEDHATLSALETFNEKAVTFGFTSGAFRLCLMTLGGMLPLFTILGALWLWTAGQATAGEIAVAAMVATRLSQITNRLGFVAIAIFANLGEVEDGIETLAPAHDIVDRDGAQAVSDGPGAIRFEGLRFGYGGETSALDGFDLDVEPGEKVALVGASGAGKSTVTSLLLRLYDVEDGRILLDGLDLRDLTQEALRKKIAVVRQETAMFNRSAMDNIRYGRPEATDDEVFEAARRAEAHDFIEGLTDFKGRKGYDAFLGERGVKLSGGQRQRVALARAILKDAPVLVLDEATSALDSEVEASIQSALTEVMRGKTVIAIAHRLSTIASMDRIITMEAGRIVEQGSHEALLAKRGLYARFWSRQSGGFLKTIEAAE